MRELLLAVLLIFSLLYGDGFAGSIQRKPIGSVLNDLRKEVKETYQWLSDRQVNEYIKLLFEYEEILANRTTSSLDRVQVPVSFTCQTYGPSPTTPTSVHKLRASDIKVVAALGDSITAGFGAKATSIFGVFTEYRGVSWSIGGDGDVSSSLTMPNIMRKYNSNLIGYSLKTGEEDSSNSKLNMAVTGAVVQDIPGQVDSFISKLKSYPGVDFNNDWKVLTIFIGGNNLCDYCNNQDKYSPDNYESIMRDSLRKLKTEVPRLFINLVLNIDVTKLHELSTGFCSMLHGYECPCGTSSDSNVRKQISQIATEYNERLKKLSQESEFNTDDDFAVVIQPFMVDTQVPQKNGEPDTEYFAPDCFHFSYLSHEAAAVALWDNMVEPVGQKRTKWTIGEPIECPTESQYLYTNQNSA